jgi:hypothetical protein
VGQVEFDDGSDGRLTALGGRVDVADVEKLAEFDLRLFAVALPLTS